MDDHVSDFRLDELASELPVPEAARAHVASCARCSERLRAIGAARAASSSAAAFGRVRQRLLARAERPRAPLWGLLAAPAALAVAAALLVALPLSQADHRIRAKGGAWIQLVGPDGVTVERARPGDRVRLVVFGAGNRFAAVLAVGPEGRADVLWPAGGDRAGELQAGEAPCALEPALEVTPGSALLVALFDREPFSIAEARRALEGSAAQARARGGSPLDLEPPEGLAAARAHAVLEVEP